MNLLPDIINDLALILIIAGIVTLLFKKLKQPLILGYIVAGILCGSHFDLMPTVTDMENVKTWADIGVIFLMFTLGLEFSFKKILKMGVAPAIAACTIIFCMMTLGTIAGLFFGWSQITSLFLGGMLAMSSTTIIFKALNDMGLQQQQFASSVMGVLVLEDILGILLMVVLSTVAVSTNFEGWALVESLLQLAFVLIVWFVVGMFVVPTFLRKSRKLMTNETLLIVSLGLCCFMVVSAVQLNYSSAFGAFMMGSILAETIEAEQINQVVAPVKDLFGAIFFVSVGMLVDPNIIIEYWLPITILVLLILFGQTIFGTIAYLLSGQSLKVSMQCGFSMAQIGEFAFIIASLGVSLKVTESFLYPVVVAVSVITTFLTPYMIKVSEPAYRFVNSHLPKHLSENLQGSARVEAISSNNAWKRILSALAKQVIIFSIIVIAIFIIMFTSVLPICKSYLGNSYGNILCCIITIIAMSFFLRAIVMRKNKNEDFKALWKKNIYCKLQLGLTIVIRFALASYYLAYTIYYMIGNISIIMSICVGIILMLIIICCKPIKNSSISLEHLFLKNIHSREIQAIQVGKAKPEYAEDLPTNDIHLTIVTLPMNTMLAGKTLSQIKLTEKYNLTVAAIIRSGRHINIPNGQTVVCPGDKLQVIGDDESLKRFAKNIDSKVYSLSYENEEKEMILRSLIITENSPFVGKQVCESRIREDYHCMLVGFEEENGQITLPNASRIIKANDTLWIVGEKTNLYEIRNLHQIS